MDKKEKELRKKYSIARGKLLDITGTSAKLLLALNDFEMAIIRLDNLDKKKKEELKDDKRNI